MSSLYQTLPPEHIRILTINGTQAVKTVDCPILDLAIDCSLEVVSLADVGRGDTTYQALSYVWGPKSCPRPVLCNGVTRFVTPNLYNALWYLARGSEELPLRLWVDALCINQDDLQDKNQQVPMMGTIYRSSVNVIVWLGTGIEQASLELTEFWECLSTLSSAENSHQTEVSVEDGRISVEAIYAGQLYLSRCDWFRRAWTLQEIILAPKASVMRGLQKISWSVLDEYARKSLQGFVDHGGKSFYRRPSAADSERHDLLDRLDSIASLRRDHPMPLMRLFNLSWGRASTDPRDRIYSLLGLYSGSWDFDIDYTLDSRLTCGQLFFALCVEAGCVHRPLRFGCDKEVIEPSSINQGQEVAGGISWIPDWELFTPKDWKALYHWKKDLPRLDLRALHPSFVLDFALIDDRLSASGAVINVNLKLWVVGNDRVHQTPESEPQLMDCLQSFASETTSAANQCTSGSLLDEKVYRPVFQDAGLIYQRIWDHIMGDCPCSSAAPHLLDFNRRKRAKDEYNSLLEWKRANKEHRRWSMSWDCVIFGEHAPVTLEPHYNTATGQLACILQQKRPDHEYSLIIDSFYEGKVPTRAALRSRRSRILRASRRGPGSSIWKTPVDILGNLPFPFYWLPTRIPIIGSRQDWVRFCS